MIGKLNVAFGFLYLVATAGLGPYMVNQFGPVVDAGAKKQTVVSKLQLAVDAGFESEETLAPMKADEIAKLNSRSILALNTFANSRVPIETMKAGPHAHGNLEALLNIVVGVVLCFLAVPVLLKHIICWTFIAGALLHSGALYLRAFDVAWAGKLLGTGIGPVLILAGLALAGIAAAIGFKGEIVKD